MTVLDAATLIGVGIAIGLGLVQIYSPKPLVIVIKEVDE